LFSRETQFIASHSVPNAQRKRSQFLKKSSFDLICFHHITGYLFSFETFLNHRLYLREDRITCQLGEKSTANSELKPKCHLFKQTVKIFNYDAEKN
jgi:hypothetical protein